MRWQEILANFVTVNRLVVEGVHCEVECIFNRLTAETHGHVNHSIKNDQRFHHFFNMSIGLGTERVCFGDVRGVVNSARNLCASHISNIAFPRWLIEHK